MDCPRCGRTLATISLNGGHEAVYCEHCRYADVESDHTRSPERTETWDDALARFHAAMVDDEADAEADEAATDDGDGEPAPDDGGGETTDEDVSGTTTDDDSDEGAGRGTAEDPDATAESGADDSDSGSG